MMIPIHNLGLIVGLLVGGAWVLGYYQGIKYTIKRLNRKV